MNEHSRIRLLKKLNVTDLAGEKVMIDFETGKYFLLKGVANDIWDYMESAISISEIKDKLMTAYEVDADTCHNSVISFLEQLKNYEFIEVVNE